LNEHLKKSTGNWRTINRLPPTKRQIILKMRDEHEQGTFTLNVGQEYIIQKKKTEALTICAKNCTQKQKVSGCVETTGDFPI
jgi:hypothetical protein